MRHPAWVVDLGRMEYGEAWAWQRRVHAQVRDGSWPDTVLLVEHPPVYTIGRGAMGSRANVLMPDDIRERLGIALYETDRGGDVTYHGPGQQVGYPILHLSRHGEDLLVYLRDVEEIFLRLLREFGIEGQRIPPHTGVWIGDEKVVAVGVKASGRVTMHGFALNVDPDLSHFSGIIPCGIRDKGVTSLARVLGRPLTLADVRRPLLKHLGDVLNLDLEVVPAERLMGSAVTP
jgi:lipoyl(octanoyl) transferase